MKVNKLYEKYLIMKNLRQHMFRVAGVGRVICKNYRKVLDIESITTACLLHDMGNILKFKLGQFPESLEPEGLNYWEKVKIKFHDKYGDDEHMATQAIAGEIGVSSRVFELLKSVGFSNSEKNYQGDDIEKMICAYADQRVGPFGIISLDDRLLEGRKRFGGKFDHDNFMKMVGFLKKMEVKIFEECRLSPKAVDDRLVGKEIEILKEFEICRL